MLKRQLFKLLVGATLLCSLAGGIAFSTGATLAAHTSPARLHAACVIPLPECI